MQQIEPLQVRFDVFELDEKDARLTRDGRAVALAPKAFAVLCTLARQPGQLVTKDALLDAVWGHRHVSDSVLKTTISELRAALADDPKQPRYIETASRRGYRFICTVPAPPQRSTTVAYVPQASVSAVAQLEQPRAPIIGRQSDLARLRAAWNNANGGRRQIFWIAGEAGVGKTTLIDSFVAELGPAIVAHGQCVEQFGAGEPYLPVLEALGTLCQKDQQLVSLMRAVAPTWLLQLPWLSNETERDNLRRDLAGTGADRMLRELAELLDRYTLQQPLLLITEDLHWSDHATVRLLDHIARRRGPARLMWLGSFRLAEVISEDHPLKGLRHELRMHRLCEEIVLDPFSEQEVADYIDSRFPGAAVPEAFVRRLHNHTDGLPLFVVNLVDDLAAQGAIEAARDLPDSGATMWQVPENLAGVMEKQIVRLPAEVRSLLEVASVCGMEFRPQTIADALERDAQWVGEQCDSLVRQQHWIGNVALGGLPDGSLAASYAFRHALYRHVFYQRIGALTRAQMHRNVASSLERSRAAGHSVTSAELASHYDLGHDPMAALRHYDAAAHHALSQFAQVEAVSLTAQAVALLPRCPQEPARLALELALHLKRAIACSQLLGMASQEARQSYERAQELCNQLPGTSAVGFATVGIGIARYADADYAAAQELGERVLDLGQRHDEPHLLIGGYNLMGMSAAAIGRHQQGQQWLQQGLAVCEALPEPLPYDRFFLDPGVSMHGHLGLNQLATAEFDQARAHIEAGMARARRLNHPLALGLSARCACMLEIRLNNPAGVTALAASMQMLAAKHGIMQAEGSRRLLGGWAVAQLGEPDAGYALIMEGYAIMQRIGMKASNTQVLCYAIEALIAGRRWEQAQAHVDEAMQLAKQFGERIRTCDLLLLQARIWLGQSRVDAARQVMRESLAEARAQQALGFELAALTALCELSTAAAEDFEALGAVCARLTEGLDVPLVKSAQALVGLSRRSPAPSGS